MKPPAKGEVPVNTILQINPTAELPAGNGKVALVVRRHSWGCDVQLPDGNVVPVVWTFLEKTGGSLVWDAAGIRLAPPEPGIAHHA